MRSLTLEVSVFLSLTDCDSLGVTDWLTRVTECGVRCMVLLLTDWLTRERGRGKKDREGNDRKKAETYGEKENQLEKRCEIVERRQWLSQWERTDSIKQERQTGKKGESLFSFSSVAPPLLSFFPFLFPFPSSSYNTGNSLYNCLCV